MALARCVGAAAAPVVRGQATQADASDDLSAHGERFDLSLAAIGRNNAQQLIDSLQALDAAVMVQTMASIEGAVAVMRCRTQSIPYESLVKVQCDAC